jgi:hypothetical protein
LFSKHVCFEQSQTTLFTSYVIASSQNKQTAKQTKLLPYFLEFKASQTKV